MHVANKSKSSNAMHELLQYNALQYTVFTMQLLAPQWINYPYISPEVDLALGNDELMDHVLMPIPAGKVKRGTSILPLLAHIALHWH